MCIYFKFQSSFTEGMGVWEENKKIFLSNSEGMFDLKPGKIISNSKFPIQRYAER